MRSSEEETVVKCGKVTEESDITARSIRKTYWNSAKVLQYRPHTRVKKVRRPTENDKRLTLNIHRAKAVGLKCIPYITGKGTAFVWQRVEGVTLITCYLTSSVNIEKFERKLNGIKDFMRIIQGLIMKWWPSVTWLRRKQETLPSLDYVFAKE